MPNKIEIFEHLRGVVYPSPSSKGLQNRHNAHLIEQYEKTCKRHQKSLKNLGRMSSPTRILE